MKLPDLSNFHVIEAKVKEALFGMDIETRGLIGTRLEQVKARAESELDAVARGAVSEMLHLLETARLIKEQQSARQEQEEMTNPSDAPRPR